MVNIENNGTFNYGACMGFWKIYTFYINVHNWSYFPCSTNKTLGKPGRRTNYNTQTGNCHITFSIKPTCFILYMCCTKGNCTCWHKGVKYMSPVTKGFSWYLLWNPTKSFQEGGFGLLEAIIVLGLGIIRGAQKLYWFPSGSQLQK